MKNKSLFIFATGVLFLSAFAQTSFADGDLMETLTRSRDAREITMQNFRPIDQRGINMFEPPKSSGPDYSGLKIDWNAAVAAGAQWLHHHNDALPNIVKGVNTNLLMRMGAGFNTPNANLYLNAQLADGIRMQLSLYLASRHHNDVWVKDGYLLIDKIPFVKSELLDSIMSVTTIKAGHMEVNYGDAHFRRSDNGLTLYNPFIGNYILDAFTTEIGVEVYVRPTGILDGLMVMAGMTGGEIRGNTQKPDDRSPAFLGKVSYDRQFSRDLRARLSASLYAVAKSPADTLFFGNRAGSPYFNAMESVTATDVSSAAWSGVLNPNLTHRLSAVQINPFVKYRGFEAFGVLEFVEGKSTLDKDSRSLRQYALDLVYRFLENERAYVGARVNRVEGQLISARTDSQNINRYAIGAGYFVTRNIVLKAEYVKQDYGSFPGKDIRHGGSFSGPMFEISVAF